MSTTARYPPAIVFEDDLNEVGRDHLVSLAERHQAESIPQSPSWLVVARFLELAEDDPEPEGWDVALAELDDLYPLLDEWPPPPPLDLFGDADDPVSDEPLTAYELSAVREVAAACALAAFTLGSDSIWARQLALGAPVLRHAEHGTTARAALDAIRPGAVPDAT